MRILHLHSSFNAGGKELRAAKLMNAFGKGIDHTIVSAEAGAFGALSAIAKDIAVTTPQDFPSLAGSPRPGRLRRLAQAMRGFDLVLSYNWGAMDGVMAHTVFGQFYRLPPLVHHEDGFNQDEAAGLKRSRNWYRRIALGREAAGLKRSRNWYRRIALGRAAALVVPSQRLETIALTAWQQPRARVKRIANGIPTAAYARKVAADALPRIVKRPGEKWLGTLAGLRAVKNLPRLVRAFAGLPDEWQLVIVGEGPERELIRAEALRLGVAHRVHLPGFVAEPAMAVGLFDLFALSSDSEQFPISVVEAMAGGLAVAAPAVGDIAAMLADGNRAFISPPGDEAALAASLQALAGDARLRKSIGEANRARARAEYDEAAMVGAYRRVYAAAMRRDAFP